MKDSLLLNVQKNEEAYLSRQTVDKLDRKELDLEGANVVKEQVEHLKDKEVNVGSE